MKVIVIFALIGASFGIPAKLDFLQSGYNYNTPSVPSGLYELPTTRPPTTTTTTTTTTTRPPPPPPPPTLPPNTYLPPSTTPPPPPPPPSTTTPPPPPPTGYLPPQTYFPPEPQPSEPEPVKMMSMLMPYDFGYQVNSPDDRNSYSHSVKSDGRYVTGEYSVLLPDGRTQIVKFTSNPEQGYVAEVTYQ